MIKTNYLGWELDDIYSDGDGGWVAAYYMPFNWVNGKGHTPEAALADAQKKIQERERGN